MSDIHEALIAAIENHQVLTFVYEGLWRKVEPYAYGRFSNGHIVLSAYQIGGLSSSGKLPDWRLFLVSKIEQLAITSETFRGDNPGYNPNYRKIVPVFAKV
jgi:predicted DNA-binding transcriptional regulator YafY